MARSVATPTNADELREALTDRKVMAEVLSNPESHAEFIQNYVKAAHKADPEIANQVREQAERVSFDFLRDHMGDSKNVDLRRLGLHDPYARRIPPNTVYNKSAMGAKFDDYFADASDFFYSISDHAHRDSDLTRKLGTLKNDASSLKPSDGGFLIPEILRAELLRVALERAVVRSRARVIPMDSLRVPFPAIDSTSNVSSIYGGITGFWTEEGATLTESAPRFARVVLEAHKLTLYTEVPNELIQDSRPSFAALIGEMFPEAMAWFEDVAFFLGGGVGEPLGFLNAPAAISVTRSTATAGNNVEYIDLVSMYSRMLPSSLDRAVWIISPDVVPSLLTMEVSAGSGAVMLGGGGFPAASVSPQGTLSILGRPVIVSEKARAVGTSGDINFVDFGFYLVGDRQAMSARQSEDFKFNQDVTAFRVIQRLDGRPWLLDAITPQNGSANTLSAYTKLTTAP